MPEVLKHCVAKVGKKKGSAERGFAICTASLQRAGILKKGTQELTAKGKKVEKKHKTEKGKAKKEAEYEKVIDRKKPKKESMEAIIDRVQDTSMRGLIERFENLEEARQDRGDGDILKGFGLSEAGYIVLLSLKDQKKQGLMTKGNVGTAKKLVEKGFVKSWKVGNENYFVATDEGKEILNAVQFARTVSI